MRGLLDTLLYLWALLTGAALIVLAWQPIELRWLLDWPSDVLAQPLARLDGRVVCAALGTILVLTPLAILVRWVRSRRYARELTYQTELGRVSVSLVAVEEALTRALEGEPGVRKVSVRVLMDRIKRQVLIECVLTLWDDHSVSSLNARCQNLLRERFAELMPEQANVQIDLTVHRLTQRPPDATAPATPSNRDRGVPTVGALSWPAAAAGLAGYATTPGVSPATPVPPTVLPTGPVPGATDAAPSYVPVTIPAATPAPTAPMQSVPAGDLGPTPGDDALSEEDLYFGPTYPVERDDDEDDRAPAR